MPRDNRESFPTFRSYSHFRTFFDFGLGEEFYESRLNQIQIQNILILSKVLFIIRLIHTSFEASLIDLGCFTCFTGRAGGTATDFWLVEAPSLMNSENRIDKKC